jgi:AraC family transcriptional regulator of adaptative response / DNA-3-methyladenine glycosylase II
VTHTTDATDRPAGNRSTAPVGRPIVSDHDACFRAVQHRDARFDGRFFTGVTSTGIFCRPSCPARTPKRSNVTFFAHAAGAMEAGFRPCRRCRPELTPGDPEWNRRRDLVGRAVALIEQGLLDHHDVAHLADRLAVSERHLRRELKAELGVGPTQLAQARRLRLARTLLDQTTLSVTDIAFAAGFSSIRQFNSVFRRVFHTPPSRLRDRPGTQSPGAQSISLSLPSRGDTGWPTLLVFLASGALPPLEQVEQNRFNRSVPGGRLGLDGDESMLRLTADLDDMAELARWIPVVRTVCDLDSDRDAITDQLKADTGFARLMTECGATLVPRLPGVFDRFELVVRAVVGQQVSTAGARTLLGRLLHRVAEHHRWSTIERFPTAGELAATPLHDVGLTSFRQATLHEVARRAADGRLDLSLGADGQRASAELRSIRGIGPWTCGYVSMVGFSDPDAWPVDDLILARAVGLSGGALNRQFERWRPWRGYAALTIWSKVLRARHTPSHHNLDTESKQS